ncbi:MAG: carbamoyl-phosphate synthase large subunit [Planctomycetaceae bacterium]|nr:carbamoyl-phosphate synthase large subunit [Planctomycetaceae bacterium]
MPRRDDLKSIMIIGSGPIVIGQGCEFDYSGTQACKALREEGYRIILINSNPATIMTDPEFADATYIEPITPDAVAKIIAAERPDALLPTLGGQTGLNTAVAVADNGTLEKYGVEMIGATREVIHRAEDRTEFKNICLKIGLDVPKSGVAHTMDDARRIAQEVGLPVCIRPAYTLGGTGGGFAFNVQEFETIAQRGLEYSPISEILIEQSVLGWKEYELEVMRDKADNVVIVCSIENFDPMGVHTGDSITVAPAQTLTDKEYQLMRDAAIAIIRAIGVETGGSNIQFAIEPDTGRMIVVEMNPRVSRSSALASKATGFPIAKIAAKLAVGYTLDELRNDITRETPACFEPTIDYCVTKIPRWTFEKFPDADETLTTQMKSVGEAMSIGRTFKESLQKGIRSMEVKRFGLGMDGNDKWLAAQREGQRLKTDKDVRQTTAEGESVPVDEHKRIIEWPIDEGKLTRKLSVPSQGRLYYVRYAFKMGWTVEQVFKLTQIDRWFLRQVQELVEFEGDLAKASVDAISAGVLTRAKQLGYSDVQLATIWSITPEAVRALRKKLGVEPVYKLVDTCAAEFEAYTPYYYSTYETPITRVASTKAGTVTDNVTVPVFVDDEVRVSDKKKIVILGGGPNRIGQGIEFDYCCVHAAFAARELGFEAVMVNSNPETVSTDYDTSDMLFFEPLTLEDVINICEKLNGAPLCGTGVSPVQSGMGVSPVQKQEHGRDAHATQRGLLHGVIVQFGGQTPLNLARGLEAAGVPIIGTSPESIDLAEDRKRFGDILDELKLTCPQGGTAFSIEGARKVAQRIGYPVLVRPSYVLGGRAMEIVSDEQQLDVYMAKAVDASTVGRGHPILVDKFLDRATEVDVDCIADYGPGPDGRRNPAARAVVCGVMEHIECAGIHSGDSACALPPFSLPADIVNEIKRQTLLLAKRLDVRGLMNVQFAVKDGQVYILEVNPRASRTVPFVAKATGVPWAKLAAKVMAGLSLDELKVTEAPRPRQTSVKESVFPFTKFPGVDVVLGPEMRSTGEVMGIDMSFDMAFAKSQMAAGSPLPTAGTIFVSVSDDDKPQIVAVARRLAEIGFELIATDGTHRVLTEAGVTAKLLPKLSQGRPNIGDLIMNRQISLLINTPTKRGPATEEGKIRAMATRYQIPLITTVTAARAAAGAIAALRANARDDRPAAQAYDVHPLQEYFPRK